MGMKKASEIVKKDKIKVGTEVVTVETVEVSDMGKQGTKKVRIEAKKASGEVVVLIRPSDYPITTA